MSTIVKNEDKFIIQWIEFYLHLGITRFIIYDNSDENTLSNLLEEYINDITVILIKWNYPYRLPLSGFSGQQSQQNHSIYAFQNCKYIGLFDVDEYLNFQNNESVESFINDFIKLKNINLSDSGSFKFWSKEFYNPDNLPTYDNNFFNIFKCSNVITNGHEKHFVIPKNVQTFSVHVITKGKFMHTIPPDIAYFNHYLFLNKTSRGKNKSNNEDTSILKHLTYLNYKMKELKFIHITKCGGTSIQDIGRKNNIKWGVHHTDEYGFHHSIFPSLSEELKLKYDWFTVVRNPYDRLISEFYCKWGGLGTLDNIDHIDKNMFNSYLKNKIEHEYEKGHEYRNVQGHHYTAQYKYIDPNIPIHIIHFENLELEFNNLMRKYQLDIKLDKQLNQSKFEKTFNIQSFSPELIELINKVYHEDFITFGYEKIQPN